MKKVILNADQIVIPSRKVDNPPILEIYEGIIARGGKDSIAPLLVTPTSIIDVDEARFSARLRVLAVLGAEYFLMDGNHRAVAHAVHSEDASVLVITNDRDLESCRKMAKRGEWPNFYKIYRDSFPEVISRFRNYIRHGDDLRTLRNKVDRLVVKDGGLPDHMKNTCKGNTTIAEIRRRIKFWELAFSNTSHEPLASRDVQIPEELRDNKEYIMAGDHIPLDQLSERLRDDDDVVFKAVKARSHQIANASERLRKSCARRRR